ncbi:MAG: hypothetical protein RJA70_1941 [Pseudomonadota bacterium]|jgi:pteridine reductase
MTIASTPSVSAPLAGKRALVTGAGTRLGRSIALELMRRGADVAVHFHSSEAGARELCDEGRALGVTAIPLKADLSSAQEGRELVLASVRALGGLDLLVASAANFERIAFEDLDDDAWDRALNLNTKSAFVLAQAAAAELRLNRGNIVFITCASTQVPMRNYLPYVVSKAATLQLMRTLSLELAPEVRVNAVAPGTVLPPADMSDALREKLVASIPLQRLGVAQDVADAVAYLASAPFVTGQEIAVCGGRTVAAVERFG